MEQARGDDQVTTIDELLHGRKVDIIKVDVEGFEARVLEGARDTLARYRPTLILECLSARVLRRSGPFSVLSVTVPASIFTGTALSRRLHTSTCPAMPILFGLPRQLVLKTSKKVVLVRLVQCQRR